MKVVIQGHVEFTAVLVRLARWVHMARKELKDGCLGPMAYEELVSMLADKEMSEAIRQVAANSTFDMDIELKGPREEEIEPNEVLISTYVANFVVDAFELERAVRPFTLK